MAEVELTLTEKEALAQAKKEERAIEWARMKSNIRANWTSVKSLIVNSFDEQLIKDFEKMIGEERVAHERAPKAQRVTLRQQFLAMFSGVGSVVKGMDVYLEYGIGKDRIGLLVTECIKKAKPEERAWIVAVPNADKPHLTDYQLVATGANAPEGWTGYLPIETDTPDEGGEVAVEVEEDGKY